MTSIKVQICQLAAVEHAGFLLTQHQGTETSAMILEN